MLPPDVRSDGGGCVPVVSYFVTRCQVLTTGRACSSRFCHQMSSPGGGQGSASLPKVHVGEAARRSIPLHFFSNFFFE